MVLNDLILRLVCGCAPSMAAVGDDLSPLVILVPRGQQGVGTEELLLVPFIHSADIDLGPSGCRVWRVRELCGSGRVSCSGGSAEGSVVELRAGSLEPPPVA